MKMVKEKRSRVSAAWLCYFLRKAPSGAVVRGYEGESCGMVVEIAAEKPEFDGQLDELAFIHNDCRVEITEAGKRWLTLEQAFDI